MNAFVIVRIELRDNSAGGGVVVFVWDRTMTPAHTQSRSPDRLSENVVPEHRSDRDLHASVYISGIGLDRLY